jgi:hypothetical protein
MISVSKVLFLALVITTCVSSVTPAQEGDLKIKITVNKNTVVMGKLEGSATAQEFAALLPLSLTLEDYSKTEKISDLPKKLTTKGAPAAITPKSGDIAFYAPWGNLAIFYRDGHHSPGLIKLGEINSNAEAFHVPGSLNVTIEASK